MIGRFPWDPFPQGEPAPPGEDSLLTAICRGALEGADAYRAVRAAVRRDSGVLRVGNRFVADGRYREVAFVALGHAANSMALAALHVFGDRLTQGFVAGPEEPPAGLPFRSARVRDGWGGDDAAPQVLEAARDIAAGLKASDLLLLLVSPGALRALLVPPPGMDGTEFAELLRGMHDRGASGGEVARVARVLGDGGVGGRLLPSETLADVQCLIVDRGDGAVAVGGGPTYPVTDDERLGARETLERTGALASLGPGALGSLGRRPTTTALPVHKPVVVATPADGLRSAGDVAFDKGWTGRVGLLGLAGPPEEAAESFVATAESVLAAERMELDARSKGVVVFATMTLDGVEGAPERSACERFLAGAQRALRRREMGVGLLRTAGPLGSVSDFAAGVVGTPPSGEAPRSGAALRPIRMPAGITDVGMLAMALAPKPAAAKGRGPTRPS